MYTHYLHIIYLDIRQADILLNSLRKLKYYTFIFSLHKITVGAVTDHFLRSKRRA